MAATAAPVNKSLQEKVLDGNQPITCRPADLLEPELEKLTLELENIAHKDSIKLADAKIDDVLTYALFPQIGIKFLKNRNNPGAFEPAPTGEEKPAIKTAPVAASVTGSTERYYVAVNGKRFSVTVSPSGTISNVIPQTETTPQTAVSSGATTVDAPLAGNIFKILVGPGDSVGEIDVVMVLEAMKMETEVRSQISGQVAQVLVKKGDSVSLSDPLISIA